GSRRHLARLKVVVPMRPRLREARLDRIHHADVPVDRVSCSACRHPLKVNFVGPDLPPQRLATPAHGGAHSFGQSHCAAEGSTSPSRHGLNPSPTPSATSKRDGGSVCESNSPPFNQIKNLRNMTVTSFVSQQTATFYAWDRPQTRPYGS